MAHYMLGRVQLVRRNYVAATVSLNKARELYAAQTNTQLENIDTWNAESNDHMIGVSELLGYRVLGREVEFQRKD